MRLFFLLQGLCFALGLILIVTTSTLFSLPNEVWLFCGLVAWWLDETSLGDRCVINGPARAPAQPAA